PGVGHFDKTFGAPGAGDAAHAAAGAAVEGRDDVAGEDGRAHSPFVNARVFADVGLPGDGDRVGEILALGRACNQASHRHGVAAHVHDAPASRLVLLANVVEVDAHVIAEHGLDRADFADGAALDQLMQLGCLRMAAIHE